MSRTIRIKNNFYATTQDCWKPRYVKPVHDFGWVDCGDYLYFDHFDIENKRDYWKESRHLHADGRVWKITDGHEADWVYRYFNRANRHRDNIILREFVKGNGVYDDVVLDGPKPVPLNYF